MGSRSCMVGTVLITMSKKVLLSLAILSIVCLGGAIFVCVVEQSVSNFILAAALFFAAVFFVFQYRKK